MSQVCFRVGKYVESREKRYLVPTNLTGLYKGEKTYIGKSSGGKAFTVKGKLGSARWKRRFYEGGQGSYIGQIRKISVNQLKPKRAIMDHNKMVKAVVRRCKATPSITKSSFDVFVLDTPCAIDQIPKLGKLTPTIRIKGNIGGKNWKMRNKDKTKTFLTSTKASAKASTKASAKASSASLPGGSESYEVSVSSGIDHVFFLMLVIAVDEMSLSRVAVVRGSSG